MIEDLGQDATLFDKGLPVYLDHDFEITDSGMLYLNSTLTVDDHEEVLISKALFEITDFVLDNSESDYRELYAIANELEREAAKLRDVAQRIEDSDGNVADLFDTVYDPD